MFRLLYLIIAFASLTSCAHAQISTLPASDGTIADTDELVINDYSESPITHRVDASQLKTYFQAGTFDGAFGSLTSTPTTLSGYGITDAYTQTAADAAFATAAQGALADTAVQPSTAPVLDATNFTNLPAASPKIAYVHIAGQSNANAVSADKTSPRDDIPAGVGYVVDGGTISSPPPANTAWSSGFSGGRSDSGYVPNLTKVYHGITGTPLAVGTTAYGGRNLTEDGAVQAGDTLGDHWDTRAGRTTASTFAPELVSEYNTNVAALEAAGWDVIELGVIWVQGEDDRSNLNLLQNATATTSAVIYGDALEALIDYTRTGVSNASLPWHLTQTARKWSASDVINDWDFALRLEKERVAEADELVNIIYGDADRLYGEQPDVWANDLHYLQRGCNVMATEMAKQLAGGFNEETREHPADYVSSRYGIGLNAKNSVYREMAAGYVSDYVARTGATKLTGVMDVATVLAAYGQLQNAVIIPLYEGSNGGVDNMDILGGFLPAGAVGTKVGSPTLDADGMSVSSTARMYWDITGLDGVGEWSAFVCFKSPNDRADESTPARFWGVGTDADGVYQPVGATSINISKVVSSSASGAYTADTDFDYDAGETVVQAAIALSSKGNTYTSKQYPIRPQAMGGTTGNYQFSGFGAALPNNLFTVGAQNSTGTSPWTGEIKMIVLIDGIYRSSVGETVPSGAFYQSLANAMINAK